MSIQQCTKRAISCLKSKWTQPAATQSRTIHITAPTSAAIRRPKATPFPTDQRREEYQKYEKEYYERAMALHYDSVIKKAVLPDINKFVDASEKCGLLPNEAKVYRDCVQSLLDSWDSTFKSWDALEKWAHSKSYSERTLFHSAILIKTVPIADNFEAHIGTNLAMILMHLVYQITKKERYLIILGHLLVINNYSVSKNNIFPGIRKTWRALVQKRNVDACILEAKILLSTTSGTAEAKSLLQVLKYPGVSMYRPLGLVLLGRIYREEGDLELARQNFLLAVNEFDYAPAFDELDYTNTLIAASIPKDGSTVDPEPKLDNNPDIFQAALDGQPSGLRALSMAFEKLALQQDVEKERAISSRAAGMIRDVARSA